MKKGVGKKGEDKKSVLSNAIKDLETEIGRLGREKSSYNQSLRGIAGEMDVDHQKEKELQKKIAALAEKEASLNQKKKGLQMKIDKLSDKLGKISKIKSEMADI